MKITTIIWQVIVAALGIVIIMTVKTYLNDKNEITAETNRMNCKIAALEKGSEGLSDLCEDIKVYKLQDSAKGNL